jgi:putative nucleotidyltransferase with HDIG domain
MKAETMSAEQLHEEIFRCCLSGDAQRIVETVQNERAPLQRLGAAIGANPLFAARLIALLNLAPGLNQRVLTVAQATSIVGLDTIKPLTLGLLAFELNPGSATDDNRFFDEDYFSTLRDLWEHSVIVAIVAGKIAAKMAKIPPLAALTAGFIHDIGRVLLLRFSPDGFLTSMALSRRETIPVPEAESRSIGIDHVVVGEAWCRKAELSPTLIETVRCHHDGPTPPLEASEADAQKLIAVIAAAEQACEAAGIAMGKEVSIGSTEPWLAFGQTPRDWCDQVLRAKQDVEAAREIFGFTRCEALPAMTVRFHRPVVGKSIPVAESKKGSRGGRGQVIPFPNSREGTGAVEKKTTPEKLVLLVVEDHGSLCDMMSLYLMRNGFHVRTANNGETALEILAREEIHMVLLDLMLPRIDGFEVLRQINKSQREKFPYILVISAGASDRDRKKVLELGANEYMAKPFHLSRLLERVQAVEKFLS